MIDLQALINGMSQQWQQGRSETQMTLGQLIDRLETLPPDLVLSGLTDELTSYRGYYSDLAIVPGNGCAVKALLTACKAAMGEVFYGYKGGEFVMGKKTPMWVADYSYTGPRLMALRDDGTVDLAEEE